MMSISLRPDGTVQVENGEVNGAFRWWFVEQSSQLVLVLDYAMRRRPGVCLAMNWLDGNLWADFAGNFLVMTSDRAWPVARNLRVCLPLALLPQGLPAPVSAYHWLSGKPDREFIVGFNDHTCAYFGRDERWTENHGVCRAFVVNERSFLIVKFHYQAVMQKAYVSVFEESDFAYFTPVKEYPRLCLLSEFLNQNNHHEALSLVNSFDMTRMPNVAVLRVSEF